MADILEIVIGSLAATGEALVDLDIDATGADDLAGTLILFASETLQAVKDDEALPAFPPALSQKTTDKIGDAARLALTIAKTNLQFIGAFLPSKPRKVVKYVVQALNALLAGQAIPAPPVI